MSNKLIKEKLHQLIDQLEDKEALQKLYAEALEFKYTWMDEEHPLTEEEWTKIDDGLTQIRNDEPCTHEAAIEKFRQWEAKK